MNIGECPYEDCSETMMITVPKKTPTYALIKCDECGRDIWYRFSRIDPKAWKREAFEAEYAIDEDTRIIKKRLLDSA